VLVILNGQFLPETQAVVPVNDRGFLLGDGLFETMRVVRGKPFRFAQHLERLARGAEFLKINLPFTPDELKSFAGQLIEMNQMPDAILRLTLTRFPKRWAKVFLTAALVVQAADFSLFVAQARHDFHAPLQWRCRWRGPLFDAMAKRYSKIMIVPPNHYVVDYASLGYFAATHGMTMNVGYFARYNRAAQDLYEGDLLGQLRRGVVDPRAVYVTRPKFEFADVLHKCWRPGDLAFEAQGQLFYAHGARPGSAPAGVLSVKWPRW